MASVKDSMKIGWQEGNYKKSLSREELVIYKSLNRVTKDDVILAWIKDKPVNLSDFIIDEPDEIDLDKQKNINQLKNLGFSSPSASTVTAFNRLNIGATANSLLNMMGAFTTDRHKQLQSIFYQTQQSQMFLLSAQNEKVIEQNDEIINLLQQIASK